MRAAVRTTTRAAGRRKRLSWVGAAVVAATLAAGGCSGGGSDSGSSKADHGAAAPQNQKPAERGTGAGGGAADQAKPGAGSGSGSGAARPKAPSAAQTHVIRTAELHIQVANATAALAKARTTAESAGGLVGSESTERDSSGHVYSRIALRVPQDKYSETLTTLENSGGKLLARKAEAKDVTDQVVDITSRIKSQRVSVARVQEFMNRATKLTDVVSLEAELSTRQAELESLIAQQSSLKDSTSMATITLVVSETPPKKKPVAPVEDEPGFVDALDGGWEAFLTTVRWIAMVVGAVAPFAVALVLLYLLWRRLLAPVWERRTPRRPRRVAPTFPSYPGPAGRVPWGPEGSPEQAPERAPKPGPESQSE
ncbi:DUF4349 domain-containing protein [Streptomyces sp. NPDC021093]|uniref:DUF4349 domain-containing protein n=1 Tax=Streptomyces sp. NPDC021093 TaxID=3365112 RepID=UPI00379AD163